MSHRGGYRPGLGAHPSAQINRTPVCQRCNQQGHWTYACTAKQAPSSIALEARVGLADKILSEKRKAHEAKQEPKKRSKHSESDSGSDSGSGSDSDSDSTSSSGSGDASPDTSPSRSNSGYSSDSESSALDSESAD